MALVAYTLLRNFLGITRVYADTVLLPACAEVARTCVPIEANLVLAGKRLRFVFYTPVLAERMLPAFAHLEQAFGEPDLTVHIWDTYGTGVELVQPYYERAHMSELSAGAGAALERGFYGVYFSGEEAIQVYDNETKQAYFWTHDARSIPGWVIGAPLRAILHWYLATIDIQLVHSAVVGTDEGAVLLTAKSGSGKSTTALACVLEGMTYLGDDYVAVAHTGQLVAYAVYNSAKCTTHTLASLPALLPHAKEIPSVDERKSVVYVEQAFPGQTRRFAPVRAILVPSIAGDTPTHLRPISKVGALVGRFCSCLPPRFGR